MSTATDLAAVPSPGRSRLARAGPWIATAARLLLGGVWIVAGALKLPDPAESVRAVRAYRLLPETAVPMIGHGLPILEVALGLLLVLGLAVRLSGVLSALLLVAFLIGVSSAWARGIQIDCGCFGGGGEVAADQTRYPSEIARDAALLLTSLALAYRPRSRLALASLFAPDPPS